MWSFSYLKACIRSLLSASKHQTFGSGRNGPHVLLGLPHNSTVATLNPDPKILQGPGHLTSWKLCHSCILRPCKIAKVNSSALRGLSCWDFMGTDMGDPFLVASEEQTRNRLHQRPGLANLIRATLERTPSNLHLTALRLQISEVPQPQTLDSEYHAEPCPRVLRTLATLR